jgi:RNA polymerase sigma-70 factor (ECF subfamily)
LKAQRGNKGFLKEKHEFQSFFRSYYPSLRLFATNIIFDYSVAEDLVQEAFIRLWEKSEDFNNEYAVKSFLYTTVKNSCLNHLEHKKVKRKHIEITRQQSLDSTEITNLLIEEETHRLIYNAINELPPQCRNVLLLSINGLKNNEIAEELSISANTVKTQKKIAYKQLKIKLKDIYPFLGLLFVL